mmetsp:Transcript_67724/g.219092  ORF Transcript_67724/g.219092 Transcript_67724/m.219092 type:complete len:124 (-) Transcript_67724:1651-2022(-)
MRISCKTVTVQSKGLSSSPRKRSAVDLVPQAVAPAARRCRRAQHAWAAEAREAVGTGAEAEAPSAAAVAEVTNDPQEVLDVVRAEAASSAKDPGSIVDTVVEGAQDPAGGAPHASMSSASDGC